MIAKWVILLLTSSTISALPVNINHGDFFAPATHDFGQIDDFTKSCWICRLTTGIVQQVVGEQGSKNEIAKIVEYVCNKFQVEDHTVCDGIVKVFKEEVVEVADKLVLKPATLCGILLGPECGNFTDPWANWTVNIPDVPKPRLKPYPNVAKNTPILRVLQLSDIHLDLQYAVGSDASCKEPLCCRLNDNVQDGKGAGQWGDYRNCDTPMWTLMNLFQHLSTKDKFDYIIWTGDLPAHDDWNQTRQTQLLHVQVLTKLLLKYFPTTPIYSAVGNHESTPVNSFPPLNVIKGPDSISWLYDELAESWGHWLDKEAVESVKQGGYYTQSIKPGFRIVSVNTNFCNNENWWLLLDPKDPAGQLKWLIKILLEAENKHEKVHIIGHIAPGTNSCLKVWSWNYYRIINRFESTVVAQFFGHTHTDSWQMFYDMSSSPWRPTNIAFLGPSVTPYSYLNPGYRVYTVDGVHPNTTWGVLDHETYILNLTESNLLNQTQWKKEYSAKDAYGMEFLWPHDWQKLLQNMMTNETLFNKYYRYYHKLVPSGNCDQKCKNQYFCDILSGRSHDASTLCKNLNIRQDAMDAWIIKNKRC